MAEKFVSQVTKEKARDEKPKARKYWRGILTALVLIQLLATDALIFLLASGKFQLNTTITIAFITKVLGEVCGFIWIALRYDFSD